MNFENIYPVEISADEKELVRQTDWHKGHRTLLEKLINNPTQNVFAHHSYVAQINKTFRLLKMNLRLCQNKDNGIILGTIVKSSDIPIGRIKYQ